MLVQHIPQDPNTTYLQFQTPHYSFQMKITKPVSVYNEYCFIVGDELKPCLEGHIRLDYKKTNDRYRQYEYKVHLDKIDALLECALEDITSEYLTKHSFGKEMLDAVVFFINSQFPQIKTISLNDTSYIPCNRVKNDTLDLLVYSIALYKKTWYEEHYNAYMLHNENYTVYRKSVDSYASKETKNALPFDMFLSLYLYKQYARNIIDSNIDYYKTMYETSDTFPEFFQKLSKTIKREDKCKFFKGWLEHFLTSYVKIAADRHWCFDLYPKITVIQQTNMKPVRNATRKKQRNNK